jgi:hypothetical protein
LPAISIKSLPFETDRNPSEILKLICKEVAKSIDYEPGHIWATWEFLEPGNYAVGDEIALTQPPKTHSPIVRIIEFEGKPEKDIKKIIKTTATIICKQLKIDIGNIFIEYSEGNSGRIFDGGEIVYR